jgi:hypothetical protein
MGRMRNGAGSMMAGFITGILERAKAWREANPSPNPQQPNPQQTALRQQYAASQLSMLGERYKSGTSMPALARYRKG